MLFQFFNLYCVELIAICAGTFLVIYSSREGATCQRLGRMIGFITMTLGAILFAATVYFQLFESDTHSRRGTRHHKQFKHHQQGQGGFPPFMKQQKFRGKGGPGGGFGGPGMGNQQNGYGPQDMPAIEYEE